MTSEQYLPLDQRDISTLYHLLQADGCTQTDTARWAGQFQPEVSAIPHDRQVMAYDLLVPIADGSGIPRGYRGLLCCVEYDYRRAVPAAVAAWGAGW